MQPMPAAPPGTSDITQTDGGSLETVRKAPLSTAKTSTFTDMLHPTQCIRMKARLLVCETKQTFVFHNNTLRGLFQNWFAEKI